MYFGIDQLKKWWLGFWNWLKKCVVGFWNWLKDGWKVAKLFWVEEGKPTKPVKKVRRRRKPRNINKNYK